MTNKDRYLKLVDEVWIKGNVAYLEEAMAKGCVRHDLVAEVHSVPSLVEVFAALRADLDGLTYDVEELVAEGDTVAARWTLAALHRPSGKRVTTRGMSFNRFSGGRVIENWTYWDHTTLSALTAGPSPAPRVTMSGTAHVNGTSLHYELAGRGTPVLLMHGGLGFDHTSFRPWLDPLADRCELVYYDHRGNGRSRRDDLSAIDHATWAADADALRAHLGFEKVVLFGHSYGGFLAQEYALRYPERLLGLVLCSTAPDFKHGDAIIAGAKARATPELFAAAVEALSRPARDDDDLRTGYRKILSLYFHRSDEAMLDEVCRDMHFSADAMNHSMGRCLKGFDVSARLAEIGVPTLVLGGTDDWVTPHEIGAERLAAGIPGAKLVLFRESGHYPFIEERDAFVREVGAWIEGLTR